MLSESHANNTQHIDYIGFDNQPLAQLITQKPGKSGKLRTSEVVYLHTDHLNTPRVGTDDSGSVVWNWQSDAFGVKIPAANQPNKSVVNLRFPGQYFDTESGLYYNYHRYYDPQTGRYITSDPIGLSGGLNTYGYVGGNPLSLVDYFGLSAIDSLTDVLCGGCHELSPPQIVKAPPTHGWDDHMTNDQLIEKDKEYQQYKNQCDNWNDPPPNLEMCEQKRWRIEQLRKCIDMRNTWDKKWQYAGTANHASEISKLEEVLKRLIKNYNNSWSCRGQPLNCK